MATMVMMIDNERWPERLCDVRCAPLLQTMYLHLKLMCVHRFLRGFIISLVLESGETANTGWVRCWHVAMLFSVLFWIVMSWREIVMTKMELKQRPNITRTKRPGIFFLGASPMTVRDQILMFDFCQRNINAEVIEVVAEVKNVTHLPSSRILFQTPVWFTFKVACFTVKVAWFQYDSPSSRAILACFRSKINAKSIQNQCNINARSLQNLSKQSMQNR